MRRLATDGTNAEALAELTGAGLGAEFGMAGAAPVGGLGADMVGGLGTELRDDSGSEV